MKNDYFCGCCGESIPNEKVYKCIYCEKYVCEKCYLKDEESLSEFLRIVICTKCSKNN